MKKFNALLPFLALFPAVASAQSIQTFFTNLIVVVNSYVIPFLIGISFVIFVINAVRFFVIGGANEDGQESARSLAMYGILGMVFLLIFWGLINLLASSFGLDGCAQPANDYITRQFIGPPMPNCP